MIDASVLEGRALAGMRILDLTRLLPGPFATMLLADMGAQVDKIEDPGAGDYLRAMPPLVDGMGAAFRTLNRGKRSVVLDLKKPEGRHLLMRVLPRYDVLIDGFRPGVMARLGLDYATLAEVQPGLIQCAISGYGQTGPLATRAGHDLTYLARAGVLGVTGPSGGAPAMPGMQAADVGAALYAVIGVLGAWITRARTGRGSFVDVSMCESAMGFSLFALAPALAGLTARRGEELLSGGIAPYHVYATKDGGAVALAALEPKFWSAFCAAVGIPLRMDALAPGPHQAALIEELEGLFVSKTRAEWEAFSLVHDVCLEPVLAPEELKRDPQHTFRRSFVEARDVAMTQMSTPAGVPEPSAKAPKQGEHTDAVLYEAGLRDAEIDALRSARIVG